MVFTKRGQLTIFVIIALVIVLVVGGYFLINNIDGDDTDESRYSFKGVSLKEDLIGCFEIVYEDSLEYVGLQGGYYSEPFGNYLSLNGLTVPFYLVEDEVTFPEMEFVESEIADAVSSNLRVCFDFANRWYENYDLTYSEFNVDVDVGENGVLFENDLDLTVESDEENYIIDFGEESVVIDSDLNSFYNIADYYVAFRVSDPSSICMDCLYELANEYDVSVEISHYDKGVIMILLSTNNIQNSPPDFMFFDNYVVDSVSFNSLPQGGFEGVYEYEEELNLSVPVL